MKTRVKNIKEEIISNQWATLKKVHFDYQNEDGSWDHVRREVYDRGDGACALLYNVERLAAGAGSSTSRTPEAAPTQQSGQGSTVGHEDERHNHTLEGQQRNIL